MTVGSNIAKLIIDLGSCVPCMLMCSMHAKFVCLCCGHLLACHRCLETCRHIRHASLTVCALAITFVSFAHLSELALTVIWLS